MRQLRIDDTPTEIEDPLLTLGLILAQCQTWAEDQTVSAFLGGRKYAAEILLEIASGKRQKEGDHVRHSSDQRGQQQVDSAEDR